MQKQIKRKDFTDCVYKVYVTLMSSTTLIIHYNVKLLNVQNHDVVSQKIP